MEVTGQMVETGKLQLGRQAPVAQARWERRHVQAGLVLSLYLKAWVEDHVSSSQNRSCSELAGGGLRGPFLSTAVPSVWNVHCQTRKRRLAEGVGCVFLGTWALQLGSLRQLWPWSCLHGSPGSRALSHCPAFSAQRDGVACLLEPQRPGEMLV